MMHWTLIVICHQPTNQPCFFYASFPFSRTSSTPTALLMHHAIKRRNPPNADQPLCSHMMAPAFFAESITSKIGFWATKCTSYFSYFFGFCRYKAEQKQFALFDDSRSQELDDNSVIDSDRILMGEHCSNTWVECFFDLIWSLINSVGFLTLRTVIRGQIDHRGEFYQIDSKYNRSSL